MLSCQGDATSAPPLEEPTAADTMLPTTASPLAVQFAYLDRTEGAMVTPDGSDHGLHSAVNPATDRAKQLAI